ncbi:hypothetical protein B0H19DRAFT_1069581 [Mycena capillaripes]|nr:hypothetical protein B0H19DRAFT_1069581 [Mycena capillaripes]
MFGRLSLVVIFASLLTGAVFAAPQSVRDVRVLVLSFTPSLSLTQYAMKASDPTVQNLLNLFGMTGVTGQVGLTCSPLGASCGGVPVCCTNNSFHFDDRMRNHSLRNPRDSDMLVAIQGSFQCSIYQQGGDFYRINADVKCFLGVAGWKKPGRKSGHRKNKTSGDRNTAWYSVVVHKVLQKC